MINLPTSNNYARGKFSMLLDFSVDPTTIEEEVSISGELRMIVFTVPALDGGTTATLSIEDPDGNAVFTDIARAASGTYLIIVDRVLAGMYHTFKVVTSGNQSADRTFDLAVTLGV